MKKKLAILAATLMVCACAFAGCGNKDDGGQGSANNNQGNTQNLVMATGGTTGAYYPYGGAVATALSGAVDGLNINVQSTGASAANIRLVAQNEADIAMVQNDVMDYAYNGIELFDGEKIENIAAMGTLYTEVCQIVVDPASGINSVADLKGKRVSVGDAGSGVEANSRQILGAYGITFDDITVQNLGFGDSANAMKDKKIDAFFVTAGTPTTAVMELASTNPVKILSIDEEHMKALCEQYPYYSEYTIASDVYSGMDSDVKTLAVKAAFIVNPDLDEELVYNRTKALFEQKDAITQGNSKGAELDVNYAVKNVSIPFHPGAVKYYKEVGVME